MKINSIHLINDIFIRIGIFYLYIFNKRKYHYFSKIKINNNKID